MTLESIKQAAAEFARVNDIRMYVSKERFRLTAKAAFGISDKKTIDSLYGILNTLPIALSRLDRKDSEELEGLIETAIKIGETAFSHRPILMKNMPSLPEGRYSSKDIRRYYYTRGGGEIQQIDVNLADALGIVLLAKLVEDPDVKIKAVTAYIDSMDATTLQSRGGRGEDRINYFEGDIVFVYGNPTDRIFYSWIDSDAGVYIATPDGWRKLLYVPGRGYLDKNGEPEFEDDKHYSDYKITKTGNGYLFVGNIHKDISVLMDSTNKSTEE